MRSSTLSRRDRVTIAVLSFFFIMATTVELYFLVWHDELPARASSNFIARMFQIYGPADSAYYAPVSSLALALEALNVFVTQPLGLLLIYGIVTRRAWRFPLQLVVGSYLSYSVILYFLEAHVSGYANMSPHRPRNFFIFYAANAPWLIGYAWLALDAARVTLARFREASRAAKPTASASASAITDTPAKAPPGSTPALEQRDRIAPVVEELGQ